MWRTNALAAAAIAAVINEQRYRDSPRRFRSRPRLRGVWKKLKFTFGNEDWKEHFRMTKATFTWLCRIWWKQLCAINYEPKVDRSPLQILPPNPSTFEGATGDLSSSVQTVRLEEDPPSRGTSPATRGIVWTGGIIARPWYACGNDPVDYPPYP